MNRTPDGIVERQVDAMLKLLRRHQTAAVAEILDQAYAVAAQRLHAARKNARQRVHEAIESLRGEVDLQLTRVEAGEQAEARQQRLQKAGQALAEGWPLLRESLQGRWSDTGARREWCRALVDAAARILPTGVWRIEHAQGLSMAEQKELAEAVTCAAGKPPRLVATSEILAGLRVEKGDACLDGTLDGLLARRADLEARLLAEFYAALESGRPGEGS